MTGSAEPVAGECRYRLLVGAAKHGLGDAAAETGPGKGRQLARTVLGSSAERAEPSPAGEGAGRCEVGVQTLFLQRPDGTGNHFGSNSLSR